MNKQGLNPSPLDTRIIEFSYINNKFLKAIKFKHILSFAPYASMQ